MVLEEAETGPTSGAKRVQRPIAQEWVDLNLVESLMESPCEWMLNHTWEVWKFDEVTQPYGSKFGKAAALKTVTKDMAARKKFRVDLVQHLMEAWATFDGYPVHLVPGLFEGHHDRALQRLPGRG